jgi:hypothetical protein
MSGARTHIHVGRLISYLVPYLYMHGEEEGISIEMSMVSKVNGSFWNR